MNSTAQCQYLSISRCNALKNREKGITDYDTFIRNYSIQNLYFTLYVPFCASCKNSLDNKLLIDG